MTTREDIEGAIRIAQQGTKQTHNQVYIDAWGTLVTVAKAWVKLEECVKAKSPYLNTKMAEFLNPPPKTDLQQLREYIQGMSYADGQTLAAITFILNKINQIEKEKP